MGKSQPFQERTVQDKVRRSQESNLPEGSVVLSRFYIYFILNVIVKNKVKYFNQSIPT
jgi:hypothetical protein